MVNKVSEDAEFLTSSAIDAADQAISWTLWLYQIVMSILCFVLLLGSYKWVNSVGCTERQPAAGPAGQAPDSAKFFAHYGNWLSETRVRSAARNPEGAVRIAAIASNVRPLPEEDWVYSAYGSRTSYQVKGESRNMNYSVRISTNPQVWKVAAHVDNVANLVKGCSCKDATTRGPICKHAAACLLMECRRVQKPLWMDKSQKQSKSLRLRQESGCSVDFGSLREWGD